MVKSITKYSCKLVLYNYNYGKQNQKKKSHGFIRRHNKRTSSIQWGAGKSSLKKRPSMHKEKVGMAGRRQLGGQWQELGLQNQQRQSLWPVRRLGNDLKPVCQQMYWGILGRERAQPALYLKRSLMSHGNGLEEGVERQPLQLLPSNPFST